MRLKRRDFCPIHQSYYCCGRAERADRLARKRQHRPMRKVLGSKWYQVRPGLSRIPDERSGRGFRERRSPAEMHKLVIAKIYQQQSVCPLCDKPLERFEDVVGDHIEPRGMGAARRDDHPDNIQAVHVWCNGAKGSQRL